MLQRCLNRDCKDFPNYGGRGITIEERWLRSFYAFYHDMGPCPDGYSLERKEVDKGYSADNCIWADADTQANNKQNTIRVGDMSLKQFCTEHGLNYKVIHKRITYQGWTLDMCLDTYKKNL
jgi:hypothetical protein